MAGSAGCSGDPADWIVHPRRGVCADAWPPWAGARTTSCSAPPARSASPLGAALRAAAGDQPLDEAGWARAKELAVLAELLRETLAAATPAAARRTSTGCLRSLDERGCRGPARAGGRLAGRRAHRSRPARCRRDRGVGAGRRSGPRRPSRRRGALAGPDRHLGRTRRPTARRRTRFWRRPRCSRASIQSRWRH